VSGGRGPEPAGPLLRRAADHAAAYLDGLDAAPVGARATPAELRAALGGPLPESGAPDAKVLDDLVRDVTPGLNASAGGRFFAWVIGGGVPAALAADWLAATWDQNAALAAAAPAAAVVEEVAAAWLRELLGLPAGASAAFTSGCQMAHVTALAAARHRLLGERGWDVERRGLGGAPALRVLAGANRHVSVDRALRILGVGLDALVVLPLDADGRLSVDALDAELRAAPGAPRVVCLQAGDVDTGAFDDFAAAVPRARAAGAWTHVDGAFGLWAAAAPRLRHLVAGAADADSWATDAHKWLNVPYDSGLAFVRDPAAHRGALAIGADYLPAAGESARDAFDWTPELSRRARGFAVYAAIRSLGRAGIADLVERCCARAAELVARAGELPGVEVLRHPVVNQGLVRFRADDGDHDRRTEEVMARVRADGEAFFSGTTWRGMRAMRVSVSNWRTGPRDVDRALAALERALD
jgi:glutamate/tyrosine decarboxylase-like PLP-dependent enzyme